MLNYERAGSGEPLVLIHGLGGSHIIWGPVLAALSAERDVIAVDMPGFGRSPVLAEEIPPTAANLGAAVAAFCRGLGIERPHIAGNSLGAWAALEIAKRGGARSVCALSPAGLWLRPLGPRQHDVRALALRLRPLLGALMRSPRARERALASILARPERLTPAEARALVLDWIDSPGYEAANAEMRGHVFTEPERVTVPVTIAWGDRDRLLGPPRPERMPPGARYLVLEGCGHTPTWDDPERVAALVLEASSGAGEEAANAKGGGAP